MLEGMTFFQGDLYVDGLLVYVEVERVLSTMFSPLTMEDVGEFIQRFDEAVMANFPE
jgi:hypothetical protein